MIAFYVLFFGVLLSLSIVVYAGKNDSAGPTIIEYPCNEKDDLNTITRWMKDGKGENTMPIIYMITNRTNAQRQKIRAEYKSANQGKDLADDIYEYTRKYSKKHPNYPKNIKDLFRTPAEYVVARLFHFMKVQRGENNPLLWMLIPLTSEEEIKQIKDIFPSYANGEQLTPDYVRSNANDIGDSDTIDIALDILGTSGYRSNAKADEKKTIQLQNVIPKEETPEPDHCGKSKIPEFTKLLTQESFDQIKAVGNYYNEHNKNNITIFDLMKKRCLNYKAFADIFEFAMTPDDFFVDEIRYWIGNSKGSVGPRVVIQRCEIDLQSIKKRYKEKFKVELIDDFTNKIKDDYANSELFKALINGNRQ